MHESLFFLAFFLYLRPLHNISIINAKTFTTMAKIVIDIPREILMSEEQELTIRLTQGCDMTWQVVCDSSQLPCQDTASSPENVPATSVPTDGEATANVPQKECKFFEFARQLAQKKRENDQLRLSEIYVDCVKRFCKCLKIADIEMSKLTQNMMIDYEKLMQKQGLAPNSTSFYFRPMRAIYNRAVRDGLVVDCKPFQHVFLGKCKTKKRAVSSAVLEQIATAKPHNYPMERARDFFLFSIYTRGMAFIDIANLKITDLQNGFLTYRRQKTGQQIRIKWQPQMQDIVDRYPSSDGVHLLGILDVNKPSPLPNQYHSKSVSVNGALQRLAKKLGITMNITMYVARHTWASIARELNVPISVISEGMGHDSEKTTQIYLRSIDMGLVDKGNDVVLAAIEEMQRKGS